MLVTVAICTWNRARLLEQTLEGLRGLQIPAGIDWELLVVDNNSTDDTADVLRRFEDRLPLTAIAESRQGHSHARNAAVARARGELLLWTDDDVIVDPGWIAAHVAAAAAWPEAVFFGGTVDPWFEVAPPGWLARHLGQLSVYVITQRDSEVRPLRADEGIVGANMAFRTGILRSFPFNPQLGRVKDGLVGGDDTELVSRVRASGGRGIWVGPARVRHYIPADRLTRRYIRRWYVDAGRTDARMNGRRGGPMIGGVPRWMIARYLTTLAVTLCREPLKDEQWCAAFRSSALLEGAIRELASRRHGHDAN